MSRDRRTQAQERAEEPVVDYTPQVVETVETQEAPEEPKKFKPATKEEIRKALGLISGKLKEEDMEADERKNIKALRTKILKGERYV